MIRCGWIGLALLCVSGPAAASSQMLVASSPHFKIYSTLSEADLRARAEDLERYDATLRQLTSTGPDNAEPLTVYAEADDTSGGLGRGILGYYIPSASGPLAVVPQRFYAARAAPLARIVLYHEYAHHFMLQNYPTLYSTWFVEGFAEFYSTVEVSNGVAALGKPEPLRIRDLLGPWRSRLSYLIAPGKNELTGEQVDELYARAWLLVHYLTLSKQRGGQIAEYLKARSSGQTEEQAFEAAFHTSIDGMNSELKAYFSSHALPYGTANVAATPAVEIRPATAGEVALTKLMPRLRSLQEALAEGSTASKADQKPDLALARQLAIDARAAARKQPTDAALKVVEAESELLDRDYDRAATAAADAIRIDPDSDRAHLALANADLALLPPGDNRDLPTARKEIVAANHLAPDDPMPLIAYYRSFNDRGEAVPPLATQGLERAQALAPQDDVVRLMLAKEEVTLKRYDRAAGLLKPVAFSPHDSPRRQAALKLLDSLPIKQTEKPPTVTAAPDA